MIARDEPPGGRGPWFCALLEQRSETRLVAHTLPHLVAAEGGWEIVAKVGPFCRWSGALHYLSLWEHADAMELFRAHAPRLRLSMWTRPPPLCVGDVRRAQLTRPPAPPK